MHSPIPKFTESFSGAPKTKAAHVFFEVPLLFEDGAQDKFDCVLIIERDNDKRIDGVINRDNLSREEVVKRINNQLNYDNNDFAMYYVIHNNGDLPQLQKEIDNFLLTKGLI